MKIGELAKRADLNVQTIRFYERRGLLPEPSRTESGYRRYGPDEVRRLQFVRQAKTLGFSLEEIRQVLRSRGRGECPCTDVIAIAEHHLHDVLEQISQLQKFKSELSRAVRAWKRADPQTIPADAICVLIERTIPLKHRKSKRTGTSA